MICCQKKDMQRAHSDVALDTVVDSKTDNWSIFDDNGTRRGSTISFYYKLRKCDKINKIKSTK